MSHSAPRSTRFDLGFYIGPCTEEEAQDLVDAILDLDEFRAVGGGGISTGKVDENYEPIPWDADE